MGEPNLEIENETAARDATTTQSRIPLAPVKTQSATPKSAYSNYSKEYQNAAASGHYYIASIEEESYFWSNLILSFDGSSEFELFDPKSELPYMPKNKKEATRGRKPEPMSKKARMQARNTGGALIAASILQTLAHIRTTSHVIDVSVVGREVHIHAFMLANGDRPRGTASLIWNNKDNIYDPDGEENGLVEIKAFKSSSYSSSSAAGGHEIRQAPNVVPPYVKAVMDFHKKNKHRESDIVNLGTVSFLLPPNPQRTGELSIELRFSSTATDMAGYIVTLSPSLPLQNSTYDPEMKPFIIKPPQE